jgi:CRP-like cAMP-binding protein
LGAKPYLAGPIIGLARGYGGILPNVRNSFLSLLESGVAERFASKFSLVQAARSQELQRPGEMLEWVYFPESAVLSTAAETRRGESLDVVLVGAEGVIGAFEACGSRRATSRVTVLIAGRVCRLPAASYREMFDQSPELRTAIHKYVEVLLFEARQLVACNALHTVEARLSRVLLDALDRSRSGTTVQITQEAIAQMLGVQRTTVAASIAALQRGGLIQSGRGAITISNPPGLERVCCQCRGAITAARTEIYSTGGKACDG